MTITGKVFLFLTLVLAVLYAAFAQPVYERQRNAQKAYQDEREKSLGKFDGEKRVKGLKEQIADAERKRKQLRDLVTLEEIRRATAEENARKLRLYKETEHTFLRDALADSEIRSATLRSALSQTDAEINARDAEIKEMDAEVQQANAFSMDLAKQVADLKAKLETAKTETQRLLNDLQDRERELAEVMRKQPDVQESDIASLGR
jgi:chromosome segregation ATPase